MNRDPRIIDLPNNPAVYALFGGKNGNKFIAYMGIANRLRDRIQQHLIRRDSSITTAASIVSLNPDYVTEIRWWEDQDFAERGALEAAEEVAFDIFNPVLRSRGKVTARAQQLLNDQEFRNKMTILFHSSPSGRLEFFDFQDLIDRIDRIEERLEILYKRIERRDL